MAEARQIRLVTFQVGPERFVFDIMAIREIVIYSGSTRIPRLPQFIEGVVVLRSEVIPIIDLRHRLFPGEQAADRMPLILICRSDDGTLGLKVDAVREIINVRTDQILPAPPLIRGLQDDLFIGVVHHQDRNFLLLDMHTLLTSEEKVALRNAELTLSEAQKLAQSQTAPEGVSGGAES